MIRYTIINKKKYPIFESCQCSICQGYCKTRPCWLTVTDARKLMAAGYSRMLMLDWWVDDPCIFLLSAAIQGFEMSAAPEEPTGMCAFFDNGNCYLHNDDLKPSEGLLAHHSRNDYDELFKQHKEIMLEWNTDEGKLLIEKWKKIVKYDSYWG